MSATPKRRSPRPAPPHELAPHDYEILAEFRYLLMRFAAFSEQAAHAAGLAPRQHQALLAIKGYPGGADATIGALAERLGIRHHSTVGLVDRLARRGYLLRREDPGDRRRTLLCLTAAGERALARLSTAHRRELRRVAPLLKGLLSRLDAVGAAR
ncbi:MAG TPA: MarR family transcriptional regulator [Steroidobacteraceae bacterium]|nr:MarR family transcriptional regulator [Steroidobacteraceae bacterium]